MHHHYVTPSRAIPARAARTRHLALALATASVLGAASGSAGAAVIDLNDWSAESYEAVSGFGAGNWSPAGDGSDVRQTVNGQPTLYYSDFNAFGTSATGRINVDTGADDDYIGFVLGFQPGDTASSTADFLLVDWKQNTQAFDFGSPSTTPGSTASEGLAVSRVSGVPTADELWGHRDFTDDAGGAVEELARATNLGDTGWVDSTVYEFSFDFGPNDLEVFVDGVKELDITGSFGDGRLGFYNFSQSQVVYSAFEVEPGSFDPVPGDPQEDGPRLATVPVPSVGALMMLGIAGVFGFSGRSRPRNG